MTSSFLRYGSALTIALLVNGLLFLLMQALIDQHSMRVLETSDLLTIDYVREKADQRIDKRREREPPPEKPDLPEPPDVERVVTKTQSTVQPMRMPPIAPSPAPSFGGAYVGQAAGPQWIDAGELVALVRIPPDYPAHARMRRIEGHVDVEFIVDKQGRVRDVSVVDSEPPGVFNRAAINSVIHWRFEPRKRDGQPVEVTARQRIEFDLSG